MRTMFLLLCLATLLAGCNTVAGIGKDVQALGAAVDKAATDTKKRM